MYLREFWGWWRSDIWTIYEKDYGLEYPAHWLGCMEMERYTGSVSGMCYIGLWQVTYVTTLPETSNNFKSEIFGVEKCVNISAISSY